MTKKNKSGIHVVVEDLTQKLASCIAQQELKPKDPGLAVLRASIEMALAIAQCVAAGVKKGGV